VVYPLTIRGFKEEAVQVDLLPLDAGGDVHPAIPVAADAPLELGDIRQVFSIDKEEVTRTCADHHAGVLGRGDPIVHNDGVAAIIRLLTLVHFSIFRTYDLGLV
jgi:hypothetical protein